MALLRNKTMAERYEMALESGDPDIRQTLIAWRNCSKDQPKPEFHKNSGKWFLESVKPNGEVLTREFLKLRPASVARVESTLQCMARIIPLERMSYEILPTSFREAWNRAARAAGIIPDSRRGGNWTPARRNRAAVRATKIWRDRREAQAVKTHAEILATLPPVSALTERATVKLLARLRRRYPAALESTLQTIARLDAGTL